MPFLVTGADRVGGEAIIRAVMKLDVLLLVTFCSFFIYSEACSCLKSHPQKQYCDADFVILARVKREFTFNERKIYKVRVRKEMKLSEKAAAALKSGRLITPSDEAMCGVNLEVGKLYVISGKIFSLKPYINLCGMQEEWKDLSRRQRKGLKLLYKFGCTCQINPCNPMGKRCVRKKDSCNWRNECETKEGICVRHNNKSCMWMKTKNLAQCWRDWRKNVTSTVKYSKSYDKHYLYP